jgi:hypothetical protein
MRDRLILSSLIIILIYSFVRAEGKSEKVCFKNVCVNAQAVSPSLKKQTGLMFRKSLEDGSGMLFINDHEDIYPFWMKNMRFPLDIIWIGEDKRIVYIAKNVQPCADDCKTIVPGKLARYILGVNAGFAEKYQVKINDKVDF